MTHAGHFKIVVVWVGRMGRVRRIDLTEGFGVIEIGHGGLEELVVDVVRDQWGWKFAEILLESAGDGVDIEIWIGNVEVVVTFEAFFDHLDLRVASGLAINAFEIHAYDMSVRSSEFYDGSLTSRINLLNTAHDDVGHRRSLKLCTYFQL